MKYVIVQDEGRKTETAILFSEDVVHASVAHRLTAMPNGNKNPLGRLNIVAAGFFYLAPARVSGESESLKIGTREEDVKIIMRDYYPAILAYEKKNLARSIEILNEATSDSKAIVLVALQHERLKAFIDRVANNCFTGVINDDVCKQARALLKDLK